MGKAAVIFISLLVCCLSHVLNKRSLLGRRQSHGHGHHGHHQPHQRQHHRGRHSIGQRAGRDGAHPQHDSENEIKAAPTGYLPAADDYEDNLAGYSAVGDDLAGYEAEGRAEAEYDDQGQYGEEDYDYEASGEEDAASDRSADDGYGAPAEGAASNIDTSYAAPDALADEEASGREADEEYGAPRAADEEYGAPGQYDGGFPFAIVEGRQGGEGSADGEAGEAGEDVTKVCPGGSLDACVGVCPGISARVYGACVQGCADRCDQG